MAGVTLTVDSQALLASLRQVADAMADPQPLFQDMGEMLLILHDMRFRQQADPEGERWAPLSPRYKARKKRNREKVLVRDGFLSGQLRYVASATALEFGTNTVYGATHHFGDAARGIPKRPWLGLGAASEGRLVEMTREYLRQAAGGR